MIQLKKEEISSIFSTTRNCINMMAGEIKNASKNVPRALVISQITLITVYLLANLAYCSILTLEELYDVDAIALVSFISSFVVIFIFLLQIGRINTW